MSIFVSRQLDASRAELQRLEEVSRTLDQQVSANSNTVPYVLCNTRISMYGVFTFMLTVHH